MSPKEEHDLLLKKQEPNLFDGEKFEVPGAGYIHISNTLSHSTGNANGFGIGVSWGRHGYMGGVLDRKEAIRLAELILEKVAK